MPKSYLYLHTKLGILKLSMIMYTLHTENNIHIMWAWVHKTLSFTGFTIQAVFKAKQYGNYRTPYKTRLTEHDREDQTKQYLDRNIKHDEQNTILGGFRAFYPKSQWYK